MYISCIYIINVVKKYLNITIFLWKEFIGSVQLDCPSIARFGIIRNPLNNVRP